MKLSTNKSNPNLIVPFRFIMFIMDGREQVRKLENRMINFWDHLEPTIA